MKILRQLMLVIALLAGVFGMLTPPPSADAQDGAVVIVNIFRLNLRTGPGAEYAILGELEGGQEYAVTAISPDLIWFKITGTPFGEGWVRGRYTIFRGDIDSVPVDNGPYGALLPSEFIVYINIPAYDRPAGDVIGTIRGGTRTYTAVGRSFDGVWIQLQIDSGVVWAQSNSGSFRGVWFDLAITFGLDEGVFFGEEQEVAIVNAFRLNLRSGPGAEYDILGELEGGDEYTVTAISPDLIWFRVTGTPFGDGWVRGRFTIFRGDIDEVLVDEGPYGALQVPTLYVAIFQPVYDAPDGNQLGLLRAPAEYNVVGRSFDGVWLQISTTNYGLVWIENARGFFRGTLFNVPILETNDLVIID